MTRAIVRVFLVLLLSASSALIAVSCFAQCPEDDTTVIKQEIFPSLGKFALVTNMGSMYDNVIHGSLEFVQSQKEVEIQNALRRKKPIATIKIKCK